MNSKLFLLLLILSSNALSSPIDDGKFNSKELDDLNTILKGSKNDKDGVAGAANLQDIKDISAPIFFQHNDHDKPMIFDSNEASLKYDVEVLESGDLKKENERYEEQYRGPAALNLDTDNFSDEDIEVHALPRPEKVSYFALFTALSIFVLLALLIYVVLITYRRNLEQRYGARILLGTNCDDDDFAHQFNSGANSANVRQLPLNPV